MTTTVPAVWCTELDLHTSPDRSVRPATNSPQFDRVRLVVRWQGAPVDFVELDLINDQVTVADVEKALSDEGSAALERQRAAGAPISPTGVLAEEPTGGSAELTTVVVCTRNRPMELAACLARLRALDEPDVEFLIVDNAPADDSSRFAFDTEVGLDPRFRYVREMRPGLSCARNRGLAEASGTIVAYTDDDVRVDASWLRSLSLAFRWSPGVVCVTGLVCAASLTTPAEHYFDGKVRWAERCEPKIFDLSTPDMDALYPYAAGLFGTGASMAFRTAILRRLGGFDEALGAGTKTGGGEDLDIFVTVIRAGYQLAYQPSALAWHHHRSDLAGLRAQMYGYGSGLTAFLAKNLASKDSRRDLLVRIPRGIGHVARSSGKAQASVDRTLIPAKSLLLQELRGMAMGPLLYARAKRAIPMQQPTPENDHANS